MIMLCGCERQHIIVLHRISQFAKSGGESYLFDALHATVPESDKKLIIVVCICTVIMYCPLQLTVTVVL